MISVGPTTAISRLPRIARLPSGRAEKTGGFDVAPSYSGLYGTSVETPGIESFCLCMYIIRISKFGTGFSSAGAR